MTRAITMKKRVLVISLWQKRYTISKISSKLHIARKTVSKYVEKFKTTGQLSEEKRPGRPLKLTRKQRLRVVLSAKRNAKISPPKIATELANTNTFVTAQTIRNILHAYGIKARRPAVKPYLPKIQIQSRLQWAKTHKDWTTTEWKQVLFSDESKFNLDGSDGVQYVYRQKGQRLNPWMVLGVRKFGGGNIMVWGAITSFGFRRLCRIEGTMNSTGYIDILRTNLDFPSHTVIFQDDNDAKHRARQVDSWKSEVNLDSLDWPSNSPDLNIIENVWWEVEKRVYSSNRATAYYTANSLWEAVYREFHSLEENFILSLFESMPNRVQAVIKAKGSHTKY